MSDTIFDIAMYGDRGNPTKMRQDILRLLSLYEPESPTIPAEVGRRAMEALIELKQLLDIATCIGAVASPDANGPAGKALAAISELQQYLGEKK